MDWPGEITSPGAATSRLTRAIDRRDKRRLGEFCRQIRGGGVGELHFSVGAGALLYCRAGLVAVVDRTLKREARLRLAQGVAGLVELLSGLEILRGERRRAVILLLRESKVGGRNVDVPRGDVDLLRAHAGIDVGAVGARVRRGRLGLFERGRKLRAAEDRQHIAFTDALSGDDPHRREPPLRLRRDANLRLSHDARRGLGLRPLGKLAAIGPKSHARGQRDDGQDKEGPAQRSRPHRPLPCHA